MTKSKDTALMPVEHISRSILVLRRQRVLLDRDLAEIYGVNTGRLNEAEDFMFQLTEPELQNLRSQIAISSWGGRRYLPFVFTEYGAIQAANVLRSTRAIEMSLYVVRAFVQLREMLASNGVASVGARGEVAAGVVCIGRNSSIRAGLLLEIAEGVVLIGRSEPARIGYGDQLIQRVVIVLRDAVERIDNLFQSVRLVVAIWTWGS